MVTLTLSDLVARNVAHAMVLNGENPNSLAQNTGIPRVTLLRRLQGQSSFTVSELERIAAHLGTSPELFFPVKAAA